MPEMAEFLTYDQWERINCDCTERDTVVSGDDYKVHEPTCLFHKTITDPYNIFMSRCYQQEEVIRKLCKMEDRLFRVESLLTDFLQLARNSIQPSSNSPTTLN